MGGPTTVPINRDPFEILEEAGSGGMGTVYRARQRATGRLLALKMLKGAEGEVNRFTLEAHVLAKLKHAAIVEYVQHGVAEDGRQFLAMEWLEGESLEDQIRRAPLTLGDTLRVARAIADALDAAHAAGIVHRDLKPSNVFITTEKAIKLLDFGIAKSSEVDGLTSTGQALGTPGYMSPEQARGGAVDGRSDLFSLGCVIFRAFGGRRPFEGSDLMTFVTQLALDIPPPLREVAKAAPPDLEALVARLLEKEPAARPASAAVVRDELDRIMASLTDGEISSTMRSPGPMAPMGPASDALPTIETTAPLGVPPPIIDSTMRSPLPTGDREPRSIKVKPAAPVPRVEEPRGGRGVVVVILASLALVGGGLFAASRMGSGTGTGTGTGTFGTAAAAASGVVGDTGGLRDSERVALDRACREWSSLIARAQRADGAFAGYAQADPSGWDSGQQLYSLTEAHRACGGVGPAPLASGATALVRQRVDDGWIGPRRPTAPNYKDHRSETPANAWGLLALHGVLHETSEVSVEKDVARARADLLKGRLPDGGFRFIAQGPGVSTLYSTMLATWALLETSPPAGALAPEIHEALTWLRRELASASEQIRTQGITEQVGWILARAERREHDASARDSLRAAATEIVAHCRLDNATCRRPTYDTGKIALDIDAGKLVTLWHPWATVSAYELARDPALDLDSEALTGLRHLAHWGNGELGGAITSLATAPEYKLSEYLVVISKTLEPR